ncbi:MAG TPA: hypothetical protein VHH90_03320 [Polyangia bacterium]|nr:hypothetical protein [Polyangia bacterium]
MTVGATEPIAPARRGSALATYAVLAALTAVEVAVARTGGAARERTTALAGLLLAKAGILLAFSLRATPRRSGTRLALLAVVLAVGFAVVLMLEAVSRVSLR